MRVGGPVSGDLRDGNGRIKLSWAQIAWGVAMIVTILGTWADLRVSIARIEGKLERHAERLALLEQRNTVSGFTQQDADLMREELMQAINQRRRTK